MGSLQTEPEAGAGDGEFSREFILGDGSKGRENETEEEEMLRRAHIGLEYWWPVCWSVAKEICRIHLTIAFLKDSRYLSTDSPSSHWLRVDHRTASSPTLPGASEKP